MRHNTPHHLTRRARSYVYKRSKAQHPTRERAINDLATKTAYGGRITSVRETDTHWFITVEDDGDG